MDPDPAIGSGSGRLFGFFLNNPDSQVESGSSPVIRILLLDLDPLKDPDPAIGSGHSGHEIRILLLDPDPIVKPGSCLRIRALRTGDPDPAVGAGSA